MISQFDSMGGKAGPIARRLGCAVGMIAAVCAPASAQVGEGGSSSGAELGAFPPAYRGIWALSPAGCAEANDVARVIIHADGVDDDEGAGRLRQITRAGRARSIRAELAWEADGQSWDRGWTLTLNAAGNRLTVMMDEAETDDTYVKCPQS